MNRPETDTPRLPPRSGGPADSLVVLLHGYGADGRDLLDLADAFGDLLPGAAFAAPHAPEPCAQAPVGRQWFALDDLDPRRLAMGVDSAVPALVRVLEDERARWGVAPDRVALVGFSQGAMMALGAMLRLPAPPAAVVALSGLWAGPRPQTPPAALPPVCLIHGMEDEVVPAGALLASAVGLSEAGIPVEWHLCPGLGHGIDARGLGLTGAFLHQGLAPGLKTGRGP
ncbi:MAG: dienelactone hydrolase family protein [Rhizobiales bacterium]|nr:dienelactone hydrolase family protein [Hyphomicrobiales bacterium]